ncbi:MAG: 2-isopropylmalate synthase, partial [Alphaproteobacteria bacterium]|nr:2-isopropylmalate synthase [Alphaproteobacteria bacterium]
MTATVTSTASAPAQHEHVGAHPSVERTEKNRVIIFDTTMRDGEQSPGASMNLEEKKQIARLLEDMGVDVIEAGFPITSVGDFEAVRAIAAQCKTSAVAGLSRAAKGDIDRAWEALKGA